MAVQAERQFVETYLQLIGLSNDTPAEQFNSTADYSNIESLGPSLPKLDLEFPKAKEDAGENTVTIAIKSIKPPFKFNSQLENVSLSYSIHRIKTDLIQSVPVLKQANLEPKNLKFMLKSKVLQDTATLSSLEATENLSIMCMVSASEVKPETTPAVAASPDDDPEESQPIVISAATWSRIHEVLKRDLGEKGTEAFTKIQASWK